jgi:two-component system, LytTR family, sensor kinase
MESNSPVKKLFRIAFYSSTAIGLITMGPVYIVAFSFGIIDINPSLLLKLILLVVFGVSLLVLLFWTINILLFEMVNKYPPFSRVNNITMYLWSYIIGFVLFITVKLVFNQYVLSSSVKQAILNWKIKEFGIRNDVIGLLQSRESLFQYLIIIFMVISINTVVLIIQGLVILLEKKTIIESENSQLKIKNIEATYHQLKQQIHPHFLFNSLNTLKTLIRKHPVNAEIYLKKLSDFLRASITLDHENVIKLGEELKLCIDYLELQKVRFGEALQFTIAIPEEDKAGFVPVFSLQQLLENAIKHNVLTKESPLFIKIETNNHRVIVTNTINIKSVAGESTGMGLTNLAERYKILSNDEVIIRTDNNQFAVSLKILSHEDNNHRG